MKFTEKLVAKNNDIYNKPPVTIAFLGDSVTQGCFEVYMKNDSDIETVFDSENAVSTKLKRILNYICPSAQINIINSGLSGDNAVNGNERFDRDIAQFHPDLVIVGYGLNDCRRGEEWKQKFKSALNSIFKKSKAIGAECIFITPNLMNDHVSPHLTDPKICVLASLFANCAESLEEFAILGREAANENNVRICDVYKKWESMRNYGIDTTELLANKINHPTREMNELTAFMLADIIFEG